MLAVSPLLPRWARETDAPSVPAAELAIATQ
jgi:hypothetical protein